MTAVITAAAFVILQVPWVGDGLQIGIGDIDVVRVGVIQLAAQTVLVLDAHAGLQAVVRVVRGVFFLGNRAITLVGAQLICSGGKDRARQCTRRILRTQCVR